MAKPRTQITAKVSPDYTRRTYYEMAPLQQIAAERMIGPIARQNYITTPLMARCVNEWLVASWGSAQDPVIGWVHPTRGALLFNETARQGA